MNIVNLTRLGGLPLTQNILDFMQQSYLDAFAGIAAMLGNNTILSGVVVTGPSVSYGWVILNGELLRFEGGAVTGFVDVVQTPVSRTYADTVSKEVYYTRVAKCVVSGGIPFSSLKPASVIPKGVINMWSGSPSAVPGGWALCDGGGSPARPDLRGRFVVGLDTTQVDYDAIGKTGGLNEVTLTVDEMPTHFHDLGLRSNDSAGGSQPNTAYLANDNGAVAATNSTGGAGSGEAHENRPPYYVLAYIIKL